MNHHDTSTATNMTRSKAFQANRQPLKHEESLTLQHSRVSGPVPFLNPTRAHFRHDAQPHIRFKWTSRNNRKGRHAITIDQSQVSAASTPNPSTSLHTIMHTLWRMLTYFPVWDISFDVAFIFTIGSVIWVINAFFVWLPLVKPSTEFKNEILYGGGITAFIGATVFEIGSFLLMAEAINENRSGCFGWAVERALSHSEENGRIRKLEPSKEICIHHHVNKSNLVGKGGKNTQITIKDNTEGSGRSWSWWPSSEDLRAHYLHSLGFLASFSQLVGASIFWISGLTALPGIYDRMSHTITIIFYWTPQVLGGTGFIISGTLFMLETQSKWWKPAPRTLGWWIGAWNLIGGIGFTVCPAFGYSSKSWAQYQACLSTFWGSWAFLIGSAVQWYESLQKFPVEVERVSESEGVGQEVEKTRAST